MHVQSLKGCLDRRTYLYWSIAHDDLTGLDRGMVQLTSLHTMSKLFIMFATNLSLCQFATNMDIARSKWLGGGMMMGVYIRMMEDPWNDFGDLRIIPET